MRSSKALMQLMAAVLAAAVPAVVADGPSTPAEWINVVLLGMGAASVWLTTNDPTGIGRYSKAISAAMTAALVALQSALTDGVTTLEWYQVAAAVLGVVATWRVPNEEAPEPAGRHARPEEVD